MEGLGNVSGEGAKAPLRRPDGRFTSETAAAAGRKSKGPGGAPDRAKALARKHGKRAFRILGEIMKDKDAPTRDRVNAAKVLLAYGEGQPKQQLEVSTPAMTERIALLTAILSGEVEPGEALPLLGPGEPDEEEDEEEESE